MKRLVQLFACQRSATLLRTSGLYAAVLRVSTNKADYGRHSRFAKTNSVRSVFKASSYPLESRLHHGCRPYSTLEDPLYEASFAEFLAEEAEDDEMGDAKSATSNASSGKRKRNAGPAFYAVRVGRAPGIYYSWTDCEAQIRGMKAECRYAGASSLASD